MSNEWDETQQRSSAPDPGAWDPSGSWDPFGTGGQPPQAPFPQPPGSGSGAPRSGPLVAVGMAYLVIVAMVVGVLVAVATTTTSSASSASSPTTSYGGSPSSSTQATYGAQPVTCTTAPSLQVSGVRGDSSGMVVTMRAASSCSGGQTLTGRWQVRVRSGGTEIAAATFDFGSTGFSIPTNGSASLQLTFPPGSYRAAPSSLSPSTLTTSGTGSSTGGSSNGSTQASVTADSALPPSGGSVDAASADALQRQSSVDRSSAVSQLSDTWSPQLSAKRAGLVADGVTYDNSAVLNDYLKLKATFPSALLIWSGDWPVFDSGNFWITMSGVTFSDPDSANNWCVQQNLDRDHCFAKRLSKTGGSAGSTKLRPR